MLVNLLTAACGRREACLTVTYVVMLVVARNVYRLCYFPPVNAIDIRVCV